MTQDDKIHGQPVQTTAKPETDDKLQAAKPLEDDQGDTGDHTAAGVLRNAWALRDGRGEHEINVHGETVSRGEQSLGEAVFQEEGETPQPSGAASQAETERPSESPELPPPPTPSSQLNPTTQPQSRVDESYIPPSSQQQAEKMQRAPTVTQAAADVGSARAQSPAGAPTRDPDQNYEGKG